MDGGVLGWYGPPGTQVGAFPRFAERWRFEGKRTKDHPPPAGGFLESAQDHFPFPAGSFRVIQDVMHDSSGEAAATIKRA